MDSKEEGVVGNLVEGKTIEVMGNSMGKPLRIVKGVYKRKNGGLIPYFITILIDGSGFLVNFGTGEFPAILFKTEDMNREAERVYDKEIDLRRANSAEFDAKYQYYQQRKAQAVLEQMMKKGRETG